MARFSILVVSDTQYLFDGDRCSPELLESTFDGVAAMQADGTIAPVRHIIHVGDVTEHGAADECALAAGVLRRGREALDGVACTIVCGNHDIDQDATDERPAGDFVRRFGPGSELALGRHVVGSVDYGPGGHSSWRIVDVGDGGRLGVLALDWRPSAAGWAWADERLAEHPDVATVVVSHEIARNGALTPHGAGVRERLRPHPQVFWVVGGHDWPSSRVVADGVEFHAVNYQDLPHGGAGTSRVYEFGDGQCDVLTICPAARRPELFRTVAARRLLASAGDVDQFRFPAPLLTRAAPRPEPAIDLVGPAPGTEFDFAADGDAVIEADLTLPPDDGTPWQVVLCRLGEAPDGSDEPLAALSLSSEGFIDWHAYTVGGEVHATSHALSRGVRTNVTVRIGTDGGVLVDGDRVGRTSPANGPLVPGPWRWRIGLGQWGGVPADAFGGTVHALRCWGASDRRS